jgi:hypothetical protein
MREPLLFYWSLIQKWLETTSLCHDFKLLSTLDIWLTSTLFQDVVHLPPAGSQLQDHCALVTQSEMMENVQYINFIMIPSIVFTVLKYKHSIPSNTILQCHTTWYTLYFKSRICVTLVIFLLQTFRHMISIFNVILWSLHMFVVKYIYVYANKWIFLC